MNKKSVDWDRHTRKKRPTKEKIEAWKSSM